MRDLGLAALTEGLRQTLFWDPVAEFYHRHVDLAVLNVAHAAEILIKASIAEEHPLLIFKEFPKPPDDYGDDILRYCFERGKTYQYFELPQILLAVKSYKIDEIECYEKFGQLRNQIQHSTTPEHVDLHTSILDFTFKVLDPLMRHMWGVYAIHCFDEEEFHEYVFEPILDLGIDFATPQDCPECATALMNAGTKKASKKQ